jgi:hypothetical protein
VTKRRSIAVILGVAGLAWAGGLVAGLRDMGRYEGTPGATPVGPGTWPQDAPPRNEDGFTLAVFLHPECPCSRATLGSLDTILARSGEKLRVYVFAVLPAGAPASWRKSPLVARAAEIPGVRVLADEQGRLTREFRATTSGEVFMFDRQGRQVFSGGITDGRGHEGDSAGGQMIHALVMGHSPSGAGTPVFGCSLLGDSASATTK